MLLWPPMKQGHAGRSRCVTSSASHHTAIAFPGFPSLFSVGFQTRAWPWLQEELLLSSALPWPRVPSCRAHVLQVGCPCSALSGSAAGAAGSLTLCQQLCTADGYLGAFGPFTKQRPNVSRFQLCSP